MVGIFVLGFFALLVLGGFVLLVLLLSSRKTRAAGVAILVLAPGVMVIGAFLAYFALVFFAANQQT